LPTFSAADACAPAQKFIGGAGVGPARVRVADVGGEEFEAAHAGTLAGGGNESGKSWRCRNGNELVHDFLKRRRIRRPTSLRSMPIPWNAGFECYHLGRLSLGRRRGLLGFLYPHPLPGQLLHRRRAAD
jgi:hypothetical protein